MDSGGSIGGDSFKVEHWPNAAEVIVHKAGAQEVGDVGREVEMMIKSNTKIADRGIRGESSGRGVIGQVY